VVVGSLAALAASVLLAPAASAHVTVQPGEVPGGGFATFAFQVPSEHETAATTQVQVTFPEDQPVANMRVQPVAGWQAEIARDGDAVTGITWTGGRIEPGQFQQFLVSGGPLPEAGTLLFRTVQTYDNGDVVRWIEEPAEGEDEPEHPAPALTLLAAADEPDGGTDATEPDAATDGDTAAADAGGDDDGGDALAVAALVVGIVAVLLAAAALLGGRRARAA
jgi:uncharacterized protein